MMGLAMPASRSLIALLAGTAVFFALWIFALKPSSSNKAGTNGSSSSQGLGSYQSDINKAHQAVGISNASNAASGNENAAASSGGATASHSSKPSTSVTASTASASHSSSSSKTSTKSSASKTSTKSSASKTSTKSSAKQTTKPSTSTTVAPRQTVADSLSTVQAAVSAHKVVALLFYNPAAADDQAVKQELASVPTHKRHVVKLAIPLNDAPAFTGVTQQVPGNFSPTLVLISSSGQASEIVGFTTAFEISQRVDDAFAVN
jgi:hypothetical protein